MLRRWFRAGVRPGERPSHDHHGDAHLIELRDVVKEYETAAGPFAALKEIDLCIDAGQFVGIVGKSGSGKTTLVNMIAGIDRPTHGEIYVGETAVHRLGEDDLAVWRGRNVGIVFQFFQLLPTISVLDNVMLPMDFDGRLSGREQRNRALRLLEAVDVAEHAGKLPSAISGGQQQRVAIARALANDPPIVVADEPTGNLDSKTAETVFDLFVRLAADGKTILLVSHDPDLVRRVNRTIILSDGSIIEEYLKRAFPMLDEQLLVLATRKLRSEEYEPSQPILVEGQTADSLYLVTRGEVDVCIRGPFEQEVVVTTMRPGQYFGEIELRRGGGALATVRAGPTGVDVARLSRDDFQWLIADSEAVRNAVDEVVAARLAENDAARGK